MNTLFSGNNLIELDSVDSTNTYAKEWLQHAIVPEGTIIWANYQSHGKGQREKQWASDDGMNLLMSIVYYPSFINLKEQFMLNKAISLALHDYITSLMNSKNKVTIKWPNDIYVNKQKIAGILIENSISNSSINHSVVGIGLNVNQTVFNSIPNATSLKLITGIDWNRKKCMKQLCSFLEARYLQLKSFTHNLHEDYLTALYQCNEWYAYIVKGEKYKAKIINVSKEGFLIIEKQKGEKVVCNHKEIEFILS